MKRAVPGLFLLLTLGTAAYAAQSLKPEIRTLIEQALANEREAVARYDAFAVRAEEEGYAGAAALFRAQSRAEATHARRFARLLRDHGHAVPDSDPPKPAVHETGDNLRAAAAAESAERDGMYKEAFEVCNRHGETAIATLFDKTRDAEIEHGNLCVAASRNLSAMKERKTYYVCGECGYTTDVKLPLCPSCRHREAPDPVR